MNAVTVRTWAMMLRIDGGEACYRGPDGGIALDGRTLCPLIRKGWAEWKPGASQAVQLTQVGRRLLYDFLASGN